MYLSRFRALKYTRAMACGIGQGPVARVSVIVEVYVPGAVSGRVVIHHPTGLAAVEPPMSIDPRPVPPAAS